MDYIYFHTDFENPSEAMSEISKLKQEVRMLSNSIRELSGQKIVQKYNRFVKMFT